MIFSSNFFMLGTDGWKEPTGLGNCNPILANLFRKQELATSVSSSGYSLEDVIVNSDEVEELCECCGCVIDMYSDGVCDDCQIEDLEEYKRDPRDLD